MGNVWGRTFTHNSRVRVRIIMKSGEDVEWLSTTVSEQPNTCQNMASDQDKECIICDWGHSGRLVLEGSYIFTLLTCIYGFLNFIYTTHTC